MDSTTDNSFRTLWGILKMAGTPDYVANGTLIDSSDAASLNDTSFADRANRAFPLTDRANTWVSAGYFAKTASDMGYSKDYYDVVLGRIKRAADVYGIGDDVESMMDKLMHNTETSVKTASDDLSNYCDPDNHGYPVFDKEGAELANEFFAKNAYKYGHERRMSIAKNIMRKSAEYGVPVSEQVRLSSGSGFPNRTALAENLLFRVNELMDRGTYKMASELSKFAQDICMCSDEDLDRNREGLFDAISGIDEMTGIDDCYGRKFYAPEEVVFDVTPESIKSIIDDAVPMGGETLSAKALSGLPRALFEKVLPKESVDGMIEGGKINPKKLSVTIISMKSPESHHLLRTIKDFTDGLIDVEDNPVQEIKDDANNEISDIKEVKEVKEDEENEGHDDVAEIEKKDKEEKEEKEEKED